MYVFVYGTLKSGEPNHHWMTETENGSGILRWRGTTCQKYPLVIASRYNIPFLLDVAGQGHNIHGEVYEIDEKKLAYLDILENYPILYTRKVVDIIVENETESGTTIKQAWTYFLKTHKPDMLQKTCIENYSAYGSHGLRYVALEDRLEEPEDIDL